MSLIRSNSNPEHLYVWSDGTDLFWSFDGKLKIVPSVAFCKFMRGYIKAFKPDEYTNSGFSINERFVQENGRIKIQPSKDDKGEFKYVLRYKGKLIIVLWETTWLYIVNQNTF
jgi:hypothetical protein